MSHRLLIPLMESSHKGCLLAGPQGIVAVNAALEAMCGLGAAVLLGKDPATLISPTPRPGFRGMVLLDAQDGGRLLECQCHGGEDEWLVILGDPASLDAEQLSGRLQTILEISRKMAGAADTGELLREITRACRHLVDSHDTTIYGLAPEGDRLIPLFTDAPDWGDLTMSFEIPLGTGLTGHVARTGQATIVNDPASSPLVVQVPGTPDEADEVLMSVPLVAGERVLGAITLARPVDKPFAVSDLEIISILAGQAAVLLAQTELIHLIAESEHQFRSLVENAHIGLFRLNPDGSVVGVNPYVCRVLALPSALVVEPRRIWGSERAHQDFMARLAQDGVVTDEPVTTMSGDGRVVELLVSARRVEGQQEFEGSLRDDTERHHLELESRARLAFLDNLLSQLPLGLVVMDPGGTVRQHNASFVRLLGLSSTDEAAAAFEILRQRLPEIARLWQRALRREAGRAEELALPADCCGDGGLRHISATTVPMSNQTGVLTDVVFLFEDVSERRQLRNQLIQRQKMDSVGSLAGGLAHDFNTILSGILGNTGQLRRLADGQVELTPPLDTIERSVAQAAQLTRQLLGFARKGSESMGAVNLNTAAVHSLDLFRRTMKAGIQLDEDLAQQLPPLRGDAMQVEQAILNLLINAGDAMDQGGVISVRTRLRLGDPNAQAEGRTPVERWLEVEIQDTGTGIPDEHLGKVFDPFFTTKEKGQGSGLGLAMVFTIMQRHGGRAEIQSRVGYGTRLRLLFPAQEAAESSTAEVDASAMVWVADDDEVLRTMLRRVLESLRYRVRVFDGGASLLEALRQSPGDPDIFLLDVLMPGMSGIELRHEIAGLRPDLRVVFCSGYTQDQQEELMGLPGVKGFVGKPFTISTMATLMQRALS
jgi:PAS domain S-box-containing protein